jgi:hypothetical protein
LAEPVTELAKEFLELLNYSVRKDTKFYKNAALSGTASDVDIIAIHPTGVKLNGIELGRNIVGEAKNYEIWDKEDIDDIYSEKFRYADDPAIGGVQLKRFFNGGFDKVLFCLGTRDPLPKYALDTYGIKILTSGLIVREIARSFRESPKRWSYYPEWYNYNMISRL